MKYKAMELNGHHIGASILVEVVDLSNLEWNAEEKKYYGEELRSWEFSPISMITHKKNGDVNVRTGQGERRYQANKEVEIKL